MDGTRLSLLQGSSGAWALMRTLPDYYSPLGKVPISPSLKVVITVGAVPAPLASRFTPPAIATLPGQCQEIR